VLEVTAVPSAMCKCGHPESDHELYGYGEPIRSYVFASKRFVIGHEHDAEHCIHCETEHVFDEAHRDDPPPDPTVCWECGGAAVTSDRLCAKCAERLSLYATKGIV
jgi:hypothetical protein